MREGSLFVNMHKPHASDLPSFPFFRVKGKTTFFGAGGIELFSAGKRKMPPLGEWRHPGLTYKLNGPQSRSRWRSAADCKERDLPW